MKSVLVDKEIQTEIKKDKANYWKNDRRKKETKIFIGSQNLFEEEKDGSFTKKTIDC